MFLARFFKASSKKNKWTDNLNSLDAKEGWKKCLKKGLKNDFFLFKTNVKVTKKLWTILDCFTGQTFSHHIPYLIN